MPDLDGGHSLDVRPVPIAPPTRTWQSTSSGVSCTDTKSHPEQEGKVLTPHAGRARITLVALDVPFHKHGTRCGPFGRENEVLDLELADVAGLAHPEHDLGLLDVLELGPVGRQLCPVLADDVGSFWDNHGVGQDIRTCVDKDNLAVLIIVEHLLEAYRAVGDAVTYSQLESSWSIFVTCTRSY